MTKRFNDYQVTLHDTSKRTKIRKVRSCVSKSAACHVATYLERMEQSHSTFRGTMAYLLDADDQRIYPSKK